MRIFRTPIQENETLQQAILRAAMTANHGHFDGYEILCDICNAPVRDHENAGDCQRFQIAREELLGESGLISPRREAIERIARAAQEQGVYDTFVPPDDAKKPYTTPTLTGPFDIKPQWISVHDRLPEPGERVLVLNFTGRADVYRLVKEPYVLSGSRKEGFSFSWEPGGLPIENSRYWMPLPESPKIK